MSCRDNGSWCKSMVSDLPKSTNFDIGRFMPRHPRVHAQGLLYHVMARGNDGRKVFLKDSDCEAFLDGLAVVRKRYPFYLYAYVLMSNHFHLLLEVQQASTARVLQSLLTGYTRRFNRTHRFRI